MLKVFFFVNVLLLLPRLAMQSCCETQVNRDALLALFTATSGTQWSEASRWNVSDGVCQWQGVQCNESSNDVVALELINNHLQGTLPIQISSLTALQTIAIDNSPLLQGSIPAEWSALSSLKVLIIRNTSIGGTIPLWFPATMRVIVLSQTSGNLHLSSGSNIFANLVQLKTLRLEHLMLYDNDMSSLNLPPTLEVLVVAQTQIMGIFPQGVALMRSLRELNLSRMGFGVARAVPDWLGNITSLVIVDLSWSGFQGTLPSSLMNCVNLTTLILSTNNFQGLLPTWIGDLRSLKTLDVRFSQGQQATWLPMNPFHVDVSLGQLTLLELLDISNNAVNSPLIDPLFGNLTRLKSLNIDGCGLNGTLPSSLSQLVSLDLFDCSGNANLSGTFPDAFWTHRSLATFIGFGCNISGTIPPSIGNLTSLQYFRLSQNRLNGTIPSSIGFLSNLTMLMLNSNNLTGTLPEELSTLTNLSILDLRNNRLTGSLPTFAHNFMISVVVLASNRLTGPLPSLLLNSNPTVTFVGLSNNFLSGSLPEFSIQSKFSVLKLDNNCIAGTIPTNINVLPNLMTLDISFNSLSGVIPDEFAQLESLNFLSLSHNSLSGTLPRNFGDVGKQLYMPALASLNVSHNSLTGELPQSVARLRFATIDFSHNAFNGSFPLGVGNISSLKGLYLHDNRLDGVLPSNAFFKSLQQLETLRIDRNRFEGTIPRGLGEVTALAVLNMGENMLNGTLPPLPSMLLATQLNFSFNNLTGSLPETWALSVMVRVSSLDLSFNYFSGKLPSSWAVAPISSTSPELLVLDGLVFCRPVPSSWWANPMFAKSLEKGGTNRTSVVISDCSASESQSLKLTLKRSFRSSSRIKITHSTLISESHTHIGSTLSRTASSNDECTVSRTQHIAFGSATRWATAGSGVAGVGAGVIALTSLLIGGGPTPGIAMLQVGLGSGKLSQRSDGGEATIATEMLDNPYLMSIASAPAPLRYASGCVIGNFLFVVSCVLVKLVATVVRQVWHCRHDQTTTMLTKVRRAASMAQLRLPGSLLSPLSFVLTPTAMSCTALLVHPTSTAPLMCLGAIGAAVFVLPLSACAHHVYRCHRNHVAAVDVSMPFAFSAFGSCVVRVEQLLKRTFAERWTWESTQPESRWFLTRFYAFILPFREGVIGFTLYDMCHMVATGVMIGFGLAYGETEHSIRVVTSASQWSVVALVLLRLVVMVQLQPFSVIAENFVHSAVSALNFAAVVTLVTIGDGDVAQAASYTEVSFLAIVTAANYVGMLRFRSARPGSAVTTTTFDANQLRAAMIECQLEQPIREPKRVKREEPTTVVRVARGGGRLQSLSTHDAERHLALLIQLITSQRGQPCVCPPSGRGEIFDVLTPPQSSE